MKKLYHITSIDNWESIRRQGLVPRQGFLSDLILEERPGIYLFLTKEEAAYAMKHWFGEAIRYVHSLEKLILLEIQLPDDFQTEERFGWEAVSYSLIPAEYIRLERFISHGYPEPEGFSSVTLTDHKGRKVRFWLLDKIYYEKEWYAVLYPCEERGPSGEVVILKCAGEDGYGETEYYDLVESRETVGAVFAIFRENSKDRFAFPDPERRFDF